MKLLVCDCCHAEVNDYGHWYNDAKPRNMYELKCIHDVNSDTYEGMVLCHECIGRLIYGAKSESSSENPNKWIPISEKKAEWPCLAIDEYGNYPFIPSGVVTIGDCCYDAKNFRFDIDEFLKGEEVTLDGEKAYLLPRKIIAWMPLPEPFKESEGEE